MTTKRALPKTWAPRAYAPEDDEAILAVYESAFSTWPLTKLSRPEASHIECWLPTRHPYRPLLRDLGFERSER